MNSTSARKPLFPEIKAGRRLRVCGLIVAVMLFLSGCAPKPRPLEYGTDTCYSCKMTLADKRFGTELVTDKGKVYTFDDINCMLSFYNSTEFDQATLAYNLVIDYENPGRFLTAGQTFYIKSAAIKSPMASQVAAFETYERAILFKNAKGGILLGWAEVTTQFK